MGFSPPSAGDWFGRCRPVREMRRSCTRAVQKPWHAYLLSKLASCDVRGRKLRSPPGRSGNDYREASFERSYLDCPNHNLAVNTEIVDRQIEALRAGLALPQTGRKTTPWPEVEALDGLPGAEADLGPIAIHGEGRHPGRVHVWIILGNQLGLLGEVGLGLGLR